MPVIPEMCKDEDARGPFLRVLTPKPGTCGSCQVMTCQFINRSGKTQCTGCDAKEGKELGRTTTQSA